MTTEIQNKRAFFRINDTLELQVRALHDDETSGKRHRERCAACDEANAVVDSPLERPTTLALVGRRHPEILAYVQDLEKRIPEHHATTRGQRFGNCDVYRQLVNISGDGIRFTSDDDYPIGTMIELILRLDNGFRFVVFAEVVRIEETTSPGGNASWNIAAHFIHIRSDDQDELIRFLLSRQMESVRVSSI